MRIIRTVMLAACLPLLLGATSGARKEWTFAGLEEVEHVSVLVPEEYGWPLWKIFNGGGDTVLFNVEDLTPGRALREQPRKISLRVDDGRAAFSFVYGDEACVGHIVIPGGKATLSEAPQTFDMVHFRIRGGSQPCAQSYRGVRDWSGKITMSANYDGDVTLDIFLDTFSDTGEVTYRRKLLNYKAVNLNSPRSKALAEQDKLNKERQRSAAMDEAVPKAVAIYGDTTTQCYRQRKGLTLDRDFSRDRRIRVCVGKPKHSRTERGPDGSVTEIYTCAQESVMSEYEYCAAAWCVNRYNYGKYCESGFRGFYNASRAIRALEGY